MNARKSVIETKVDGITFRSRTEAAWYVFFRDQKMNPVYEPEMFVLQSVCDETLSCRYLPDFVIRSDPAAHEWFCEIKGSVDDMKGIAKACILGYQHPTLIIIGSPMKHACFLVKERHKGNPEGIELEIKSAGVSRELGFYKSGYFHFGSSYPDEHWLEMSHEDLEKMVPYGYSTNAQLFLNSAWNSTRWEFGK